MRRLEALSRVHDRDGFDCGSEPLNRYLRETARQHAERGIARTFVLVDSDAGEGRPILGYFSLTLCQVIPGKLPPEDARKLPDNIHGVLLGRLAVAKSVQGQGVGKMLLGAVLEKFMTIFEAAGGVGLFVDAKDEGAQRFYEGFGFVPMPSNPLQLFLPLKTIQAALRCRGG
ncbi:MAG: GNAT family N-acetyltransferase [Verrucomicrobiota bacterium]|jgi:GNAT superfamily N-acetyltransferase